MTTGALSGTIKDPSGSVVPAADVTATNSATGAKHTVQSQGNGGYLIPLLEPGTYTISVAKTGFQTAKQSNVAIAVSTTGALDFKLTLGASSQTIEVTGEPPLIQPQNANTTTTLTAKAIENLPNPGGDITMLAQISPGATMMVHGGGGTAGLAFNGVQGNAVEYTQDGMDDNDPFNNDNNSGPSNMLLGQNAVSEVTVNTNSYSVDQGRMSAGQVNYLSKSGSNTFHGDASWQWNGRAVNANDFFNQNTPGVPALGRSFDNVNNWTASIGGPIVKNKLFFFFDNEGTRIDLPQSIGFKVPTPFFETYSEQQMALGGYDTNKAFAVNGQYKFLPAETGANAPAGVDELPYLKSIYALYGDTSVGTRGNVQITPNTSGSSGCNIINNAGTFSVDPSYNPQLNPTPRGGANAVPSDNGCYNIGTFNGSATTPETLTSFRLDYNLNSNNTVWGKFLNDVGTQTTATSPINPVLDENSYQPDRQGLVDWTHIFTPNLTNDAETGFLWYSAIFKFNQGTAEQTALGSPTLGEVSTPFGNLGSTSFPQGRNVTQYQIIDNMTWTRGTHSYKLGENFRRELVNDHDFAEVLARTDAADYAELDYGAASLSSQRFPIAQVEQFKDYSLDLYAMDTWQWKPNVTVTYGIRATHNSNPVDAQPYMAQYTDFAAASHSVNTAPNALFTPVSQLWTSVPFETWQPRVSVAWQPRQSTLIKAGWGMFGQVASASTAETLARNAPFDPTFQGGFGTGNLGANGSAAGCTQNGGNSPQCGYLFAPNVPGNAIAAAVAGNAAFQANFSGGALSCASPNANPAACVPQSSITALPASGLQPPMVYDYSFGVQQQLTRNTALSVGYVGTRSQHNSYTMDDNAYETLCSGCFAPYLYSPASVGSKGAPDPRFTGYSQVRYDGYGDYNSMQASYTVRTTHNFTLNLNYTWAKCMTTGTPYEDGGGFASSLANVYDECGDDINQALNASYSYLLPFHESGFLGNAVNGWQISGSTISQGGQPLFISEVDGSGSTLTSNFADETGPMHGMLGSGSIFSKNLPISEPTPTGPLVITQPSQVQWLNNNAILTNFDANTGECYSPSAGTEGNTPALCQFNGNNGAIGRGPRFQWTNLDIGKTFQLNERFNLRLDFQGYNVFNHPNFASPNVTGNVLPNPSDPATANKNPSLPGNPGGTLANGNDGIGSLTAPNNSLLGQNGGDAAPRMLAFQAKIIF